MEKSSNPARPKISCDDPRLSQFKVFANLTSTELATLLELSDTVSYDEGDRILRTGDSSDCMYLILAGSAKVSVDWQEKTVELAELGAGDFFGEVGLVDNGPRTADVTALSQCELLCISGATIGVLAGLQPGAAIQILGAIGRILAHRVRTGSRKYLDLLFKDHEVA